MFKRSLVRSGLQLIYVAALSSALILPVTAESSKAVDIQTFTYKDTFNCSDKQLDWMKDCAKINEQINNNPNSTVRTITKEGIELYFIPGTPKAHIKLQTLRTPQAAKEYADYLAALNEIDNESAALMRIENAKRKLNRLPTTEDMSVNEKYRKNIDYDNISLYMFYDTNCAFCQKQFVVNDTLKDMHPKLKMNMLQINNDLSGFAALQKSYNFKSRILNSNELAKFRDNITQTPTILIQNTKTKQHLYLHGYRKLNELEKYLSILSGTK